jgi:photosystem II stability/assembly factor-like uncharacterized protein
MRQLACALTIAILLIVPISSDAVMARGPMPLGWEQLPLPQSVLRLDAPRSGALFARTSSEFLRSEDGGMSWLSMPLPPGPSIGSAAIDAVVVDPTDQSVLFAAGREGIYRSVGQSVNWTLMLQSNIPTLRISVSAANPRIVYAAMAQGSGSFQVWRSDDRGENWTQIEGPLNGAVCIWEAPILAPHASVADLVFGSWTCMAGREIFGGGSVQRSVDRGANWTEVLRRSTYFPRLLVSAPTDSSRAYLIENRGAAPGDGFMVRSDDGGVTWTDAFVSDTDESLGGLAVDPAQADRVVVGTRRQSGDGQVWLSTNAGNAWTQLGSPEIGSVQSLAFSADRAYLFAATQRGLYRYPLAPGT